MMTLVPSSSSLELTSDASIRGEIVTSPKRKPALTENPFPSTQLETETTLKGEWVQIEEWGEKKKHELLAKRNLSRFSVEADHLLIDFCVPRVVNYLDEEEYLLNNSANSFLQAFPKVKKRQLELAAMRPAKQFFATISDLFSPPR